MARPELTSSETDAFREQAAAAALALVEQEGVANLTLRRLAARLGCSYAKPYRYYRDKDHLIDAVRGLGFDRLAAYASGEDSLTADVYFRFAAENPELYRVMFALRQAFVSPETRAARARAWEACSRPFHRAVAEGELEGDPELIAHTAWVAMHGLVTLELADQLRLGCTFEQVAGAMQRIVDGFRPRHGASERTD